jgi:glycosyltransferase involved in cell wall biosynthesis
VQVAFFTDSYPPMRDGVAEITGGLARSLVRLGVNVRVFAPQTANGVPSESEEDGVRVRRVRSVPVPLYAQYRWPVFPLSLVRGARGLAEADVVHVHTPGGIGSAGFLASRRFGRPLVGTFHTNIRAMEASVPPKFLVPQFFRVAWWWNLGLYWRCDVATAPSVAARTALEMADLFARLRASARASSLTGSSNPSSVSWKQPKWVAMLSFAPRSRWARTASSGSMCCSCMNQRGS